MCITRSQESKNNKRAGEWCSKVVWAQRGEHSGALRRLRGRWPLTASSGEDRLREWAQQVRNDKASLRPWAIGLRCCGCDEFGRRAEVTDGEHREERTRRRWRQGD